MKFEENELLFGADPTQRIVAIEMGETGTVRVYRREKDGSGVPVFFDSATFAGSTAPTLNMNAGME